MTRPTPRTTPTLTAVKTPLHSGRGGSEPNPVTQAPTPVSSTAGCAGVKRVATPDDLLGLLTDAAVARGSFSGAQIKDRLRAMEMLGKAQGLFVDRVENFTKTIDPAAAMPSEQRWARIEELTKIVNDADEVDDAAATPGDAEDGDDTHDDAPPA